jgi:hypothetical protein
MEYRNYAVHIICIGTVGLAIQCTVSTTVLVLRHVQRHSGYLCPRRTSTNNKILMYYGTIKKEMLMVLRYE